MKFLKDKKKYGKTRIISGITQAVNYAKDYSKKRGFVLVFNANENDCKLIIDSDEGYLPSILIDGVKIYVILVNFNPNGKTASKQGNLKSIVITSNGIIKDFN